MSGDDIQSIVELLRQPPFHRSEGLVDFSKKSTLELLQVVNDVFAAIDDRQKRDLRDEGKDEQTARMLAFVTVLGYKIEAYEHTQRQHAIGASLTTASRQTGTRDGCQCLTPAGDASDETSLSHGCLLLLCVCCCCCAFRVCFSATSVLSS